MTLHIDAVLFDLDGVLVDSTANVERHWTEWAVRVGLDPAAFLPTVHGRRAVDIIRGARPELDVDAELAFMIHRETEDLEGVAVMPGARDFVAQLPPERWGVVTSGVRSVATARLEAAGIPVPRVLIPADEIARGKPDPQGYLLGARRLAVEPARCVVCEDAPAGAEAARAAAMRLIALTSTHDARELAPADLIVADLSELAVEPTSGGLAVRRVGAAREARAQATR
jgi:mannitol-1-/sugar-/sorbitol-6-phosphatase